MKKHLPIEGQLRYVKKFVISKKLPPLFDIDVTDEEDREKKRAQIPNIKRMFESTVILQYYTNNMWNNVSWADINASDVLKK